MEKVSIIVPVYNVEQYLEECVESIIHQTYTNIEIILIDDGSTDRSGTICDLCSTKDERIKVIHKDNGGISSARNCGINVAQGKYLIFVDSDDYWCDNDILTVLSDLAENNSLDLIRGEYMEIDDCGNHMSMSRAILHRLKFQGEVLDSYVFYKNIVRKEYFSVLCLYKTEVIRNMRFNEERFFLEDAEFYLDLCLRPLRCMYIPRTFYAYRKHSESVSVRDIPNKFMNALNFTLVCFDKSIKTDNKHLASAYCIDGIKNFCYDLQVIGESDALYAKRSELYVSHNIYNIKRRMHKVVIEKRLYRYVCAMLPLNQITLYYRVIYRIKKGIRNVLRKLINCICRNK